MQVIFNPIGIIHTPFTRLKDMPIQPTGESSAAGVVEIKPEYTEALKDLDGFSHIYLIYHLHRVQQSELTVTPFLDSTPRGIFATRAPNRPNPIGLSLVKIVRIEINRIHVEKVDVLDQTPLLDIKPYVPEFEQPEDVRIGWLEKARDGIRTQRSDDRFV